MHVPHGVIRPHHAILVASAKIPTRHGQFDTHVFSSPGLGRGVERARLDSPYFILGYAGGGRVAGP